MNELPTPKYRYIAKGRQRHLVVLDGQVVEAHARRLSAQRSIDNTLAYESLLGKPSSVREFWAAHPMTWDEENREYRYTKGA